MTSDEALLGPGRLVAIGDIAKLYQHERGLLKVTRDPADNDLLDREAAALTRLRASPYVPALIEAQRRLDPGSGLQRRANLISRLDGFVTLAEVRTGRPDGLDPRDVAWMWRGLLVAIGFVHRAGVIHAAVLPEHVLIHPARHHLALVDWCYAVTGSGDLASIPGRYDGWYPAEVRSHKAVGPDLDIYLATRCMTHLLRRPVPLRLAAFAHGCTLPNRRRRPRDAWRLLAEFDAVLERLYGSREFRLFARPA